MKPDTFNFKRCGVEGVRKSEHQGWLAKGLGLGLLCWGFKGVQEEIPSEEASILQTFFRRWFPKILRRQSSGGCRFSSDCRWVTIQEYFYPVMADGIRTGDPWGFNKGRSSKFGEGSRVRQTPEGGRRTYRPKRCGNNNKVKDNSPKIFNDKKRSLFEEVRWNKTNEISRIWIGVESLIYQTFHIFPSYCQIHYNLSF